MVQIKFSNSKIETEITQSETKSKTCKNVKRKINTDKRNEKLQVDIYYIYNIYYLIYIYIIYRKLYICIYIYIYIHIDKQKEKMLADIYLRIMSNQLAFKSLCRKDYIYRS